MVLISFRCVRSPPIVHKDVLDFILCQSPSETLREAVELSFTGSAKQPLKQVSVMAKHPEGIGEWLRRAHSKIGRLVAVFSLPALPPR